MLKLISFKISGEFSAFRDPSITSNQTAYYIPSKSAIIGILGAMIGIERSDKLNELYSVPYLDFFKKTKVGICYESIPKKTIFFTNHRSLKKSITKPFKTELVVKPTYTIFVKTNDDNHEKILHAIVNHEFEYSPYLGHAYCIGIISDFEEINTVKITDLKGTNTQCVVLDESETFNEKFELKIQRTNYGGSMIVERHIHHFFDNGEFDARVLRHWIPTNDSVFRINKNLDLSLSEFYNVKDHVVCMY